MEITKAIAVLTLIIGLSAWLAAGRPDIGALMGKEVSLDL